MSFLGTHCVPLLSNRANIQSLQVVSDIQFRLCYNYKDTVSTFKNQSGKGGGMGA